MKQFFILAIALFCFQTSYAQSELKSIIINKTETIPSNWVEQIQEKGSWIYVKTVLAKGRRVKDYLTHNKFAKEWQFEKTDANVLPYLFRAGNEKYSNCSVRYYPENNTFLLTTMVNLKDNQVQSTKVYQVMNLTDEYLILEEIMYTHCFDFDSGRKLSKKECVEKYKNEPKRMFGGTVINIRIGIGKPAKIRMVLKIKE